MLLCAFLTFIIYRLVDLHKFLLKSIYTALCLSRSQSVMFCLSPEGQTFLSHRRGGDKHFLHTGGRHYKPTSCPWAFVYDYACMSYEDRHIKGHIMIGICWSYTSGHGIRLLVK